MCKYAIIWILCLVIGASVLWGSTSARATDKRHLSLKRFGQRIAEKARDHKSRPVLIVAFGDSVTMGATEQGKFDFENVYHARLKRLLQRRYPRTVFSVINAGVGGERARDGLKRLDRDVISFQPDLVVVGFGLNDTGDGEKGVGRFEKSMREIVRRISSETKAGVILLTPNFMNTSDNPNVSDAHRKLDLPALLAKRQRSGITASYVRAIRKVGMLQNVPVADTYQAWETLAERGVDTNGLLANGLNHPTPAAHQIPAELILKLIDPNFCITAIDDLSGRSPVTKPMQQ